MRRSLWILGLGQPDQGLPQPPKDYGRLLGGPSLPLVTSLPTATPSYPTLFDPRIKALYVDPQGGKKSPLQIP